MNLKEATKIVDDNYKSANNSLLHFTHEKSLFDEEAFWMFYNAIRFIGFETHKEDVLRRELTFRIIKSYGYFLLQIGFHFNQQDQYSIKNLPYNYVEYCSRLMEAVDAYLNANPISDETEEYSNRELNNLLSTKMK